MMQRDRRLGDALRAALTRPDEAGFVRRVVARIDETGTWWEVLGRWARPALAASLLLAAAAGFWLGQQLGPGAQVALEETPPVTGPAGTVTAMFTAPAPPDMDVLLAVASGQD